MRTVLAYRDADVEPWQADFELMPDASLYNGITTWKSGEKRPKSPPLITKFWLAYCYRNKPTSMNRLAYIQTFRGGQLNS